MTRPTESLDAPPLTTARQAVLDALRKGPQSAPKLYALTPVYFAAISQLRFLGHNILSDVDASGDRVFTIYDQGGL